MVVLKGRVVQGCGHFRQRMTKYPEVFREATGEELFKGTLNVEVGRPIPVKEQFRISGAHIAEPEQDLLFEVCRINGIWAYRIRPYDLRTGCGGHGDDTLEIACSYGIPNVSEGTSVEVALFRDDIKA
jgi:CTP-dependent riboflavin kinase